MKKYLAELHIHTVLSPCAEVEMIPPLIVQEALDKKLNLIAISDHNTSANVSSVIKAARGTGLTVLPAIEVQTREEVHLLCIFDRLDQLFTFQTLIDAQLPPLLNDPDHFGEQFVVDETGEFLRREERLLLTSVDLSIDELYKTVNELGGLSIPAHIDRQAFGIIPVLGFIPPDLCFEALEISRNISIEQAKKLISKNKNYPIIISGDAHRLDEIIGLNIFELKEPSIAEIRKAFRGEDNRSFHTCSV